MTLYVVALVMCLGGSDCGYQPLADEVFTTLADCEQRAAQLHQQHLGAVYECGTVLRRTDR